MRFSKVSMPPLFHKYEFYPISLIDFTLFSLTYLHKIRYNKIRILIYHEFQEGAEDGALLHGHI